MAIKFLTFYTFLAASINPFEILFEDKKDLEIADIVQIQHLLREVDTQKTLKNLYPDPEERGVFERYQPIAEFENRISRCLKQVLADPEKGLVPEVGLVKINRGGGNCFVVGCPFNRQYPHLLQSLIQGLKEIGFDGHVYYRIGGVPNPTGTEAKWAGVPYSFKIFMMMEAHKLGLSKVIWLDSALFPFKNPKSLFRILETQGAFVLHRSHPKSAILPATMHLIEVMTRVDVSQAPHVRMWVFGLDMDRPWVSSFLKDYTGMCKAGVPFISCYPEEFVISALVKKFEAHIPMLHDPVYTPKHGYGKVVKTHDHDWENYWRAKKEGYMFVVRDH
jgi:hypothetical protein